MAWTSKVVCSYNDRGDISCNDADGAIVHLFNENTSLHGHTMMSIEYQNGTFWGLSFEPENSNAPASQKLFGTKAVIRNRTFPGQASTGVSGKVADYVATYVLSKAQSDALTRIIDKELQDVQKGVVTYAIVGRPFHGIFSSGYRDTCYSWTIRVLTSAGIISPVWRATRWMSLAPASTWSTADTRPNWV